MVSELKKQGGKCFSLLKQKVSGPSIATHAASDNADGSSAGGNGRAEGRLRGQRQQQQPFNVSFFEGCGEGVPRRSTVLARVPNEWRFRNEWCRS